MPILLHLFLVFGLGVVAVLRRVRLLLFPSLGPGGRHCLKMSCHGVDLVFLTDRVSDCFGFSSGVHVWKSVGIPSGICLLMVGFGRNDPVGVALQRTVALFCNSLGLDQPVQTTHVDTYPYCRRGQV